MAGYKKEKHEKEEVRKPKYNTLSCFVWMMQLLWKNSKTIALAAIGVIPLAIILYAFNLYLTPTIIGLFETKKEFHVVSVAIVLLLLSQLIFRITKDWVDQKRDIMKQLFTNLMQVEMFAKKCELEYYIWLNPKNRETEQRAWNASNSGGQEFPQKIANMAVNIICFVFFSSVIATLNPIIIVLLCFCSLIDLSARKYKVKRDYRGVKKRDLNHRKINYLSYGLARDMKPGKDIRMFSMQHFLSERAQTLIKENEKNLGELQNTQTIVHLISNGLNMARDGIAYAILFYAAINGEMSVAQFSLYFGAISQLSNFFTGIVGEVEGIFSSSLKVSDFREYMDMEGKLNRGSGIVPRRGIPVSVEFKNVSYKYPGAKKNVIENVSFKINPGEKVALVGTNGAGKTTVVSLMCGLIVPDNGEILIDDHSIYEYNKDELYKFFSIVPQDFCLLPSTIAENVVLCEKNECDVERLNEALQLSGLWEKVCSLKYGVDTLLEGRYNPGGVKLSGGEVQKLLLARSVYRQSQVMILDEPTASLDPIAEDDMYRKYVQLSRNCTSIFVSHRLASTRFCDKIYMLDGGVIIECGTHEQLIHQKGKYHELFNVQSEYYR